MPHKDDRVRRAYHKAYHKAHKEDQNRRMREWYEKNAEDARARTAAYTKAVGKEGMKENFRRYRRKLKQSVIDAYGGKCACCGERNMCLLTVDHINNDGAEHRRQLAASLGKTLRPGQKRVNVTSDIYRWLRNNNFPPEFQLLCWNCNSAKGFYGEGTCHPYHDEPALEYWQGLDSAA